MAQFGVAGSPCGDGSRRQYPRSRPGPVLRFLFGRFCGVTVTLSVMVSSYEVIGAKHVIAEQLVSERQCVVEEPVGAVPLRAREPDLGASPVAAPQLSFTAVERQDRFPLKRDRDKGKPGESRRRKATRLQR